MRVGILKKSLMGMGFFIKKHWEMGSDPPPLSGPSLLTCNLKFRAIILLVYYNDILRLKCKWEF